MTPADILFVQQAKYAQRKHAKTPNAHSRTDLQSMESARSHVSPNTTRAPILPGCVSMRLWDRKTSHGQLSPSGKVHIVWLQQGALQENTRQTEPPVHRVRRDFGEALGNDQARCQRPGALLQPHPQTSLGSLRDSVPTLCFVWSTFAFRVRSKEQHSLSRSDRFVEGLLPGECPVGHQTHQHHAEHAPSFGVHRIVSKGCNPCRSTT